MKIGIVCPYNMALGGAVQEIVKESYAELVKRGHEVVVITPTPVQGEPEFPTMRVLFVDKANDLKALGTVAQVSLAFKPSQITEILEREKFDVLHMHEPWVPLMNRQILKRAKCPVVATFHAKLPDSFLAKLVTSVGQIYTKPTLKYIDEFIAVSEPAAEHICSLTDREVRIIPNAIPVGPIRAARTGKPIKKDWKTIFYVGRLEERKGVGYMLSAFRELRKQHEKVQLIVAGKGPDMAALQRRVVDEAIPDVEFTGFIEHEDKLKLYANSDLFCAPAPFGESFGISPLEGLAGCGVLVAGDNPGYRSVFKEFGQLSLVDPKNISDLMGRLELMLFNEPLRKISKEWAEGYALQFDYPHIVDRYEEIFKDVAAKRKTA